MTSKIPNLDKIDADIGFNNAIKQLAMMVVSQNDYIKNLDPETYLTAEQRSQVIDQGDSIFGEMILSGLAGVAMPGLDGIFNIGTDWAEIITETWDDLRKSTAMDKLTPIEREELDRYRKLYQKERQSRNEIAEQKRRAQKNRRRLIALMALAEMEKQTTRREAEDMKRLAATERKAKVQKARKDCVSTLYANNKMTIHRPKAGKHRRLILETKEAFKPQALKYNGTEAA